MKCKRVGVIGGGQLAWMMAEEAQALGIELIVQTPNQDDPAVSRATEVIFASIDDAEATAKLATRCDVITFENEFIDLEALQVVAQQGVSFCPSLTALSPLLDKYEQRSYLQQIGLPVPQFSAINVNSFYGFPVVLKARRHGYDGQGTFILKDNQALTEICQRLPTSEMLMEEYIPFSKELAVMAARNASGEVVTYPVVETYQQDQVCRWVIAPGDVSEEVQQQVKAIATTLLTKLEVVGIFGIELFLTTDGKVLVNEVAPRTHNSGHYTLDACDTSQFKMQLQAVTGLPLGSPQLKSAGAVMVNLLGYEYSENDYLNIRNELAAIPNSYIHWYGKNQSRPGRKLGHVTVLLQKEELFQAKQIAEKIESIWYKK
ncbi:5-(carboxyamino)imidazole ribonucleotide synthase [Stanieria cyanosphaera PCC 7437]|uniref:N5-carboxyaminoimidazole ribonucleotide synthase n=1 Tax=Stanieria cyanosphaera (strain ATCC 29371 / PCC 7437) TaxID=111780 RepID=K9XRW8_STAC7|nr:5-(carboxyamino)imidazole ribonucleotide synthase [Stanieria cyanosphaera]AFZ34829.1 5-(carboxyamino)imidazole ribonucleotide synthase [Stanieria cyanosphaera PCC 7437]